MVPFTQYLLPNGRRKTTGIDCSPAAEALADKFIASGGRYECEVLRTGHVSLTAVHAVDGEQQDIAIKVCANGPVIPQKVEELIADSVKWLEDR